MGKQRALPVVLLSLLVVPTSCSFLGGTPTPDSGPDTPTGDDEVSPTASPMASPTFEQSSYSSFFSANGVTGTDTANRGHVGALVDVGNFHAVVRRDHAVVRRDGRLRDQERADRQVPGGQRH